MQLTTRVYRSGLRIVLRDGQPAGYTLLRGGYVGTSDNRADRWYIDRNDTDCLDRRGPGYRTVGDALSVLAERIG